MSLFVRALALAAAVAAVPANAAVTFGFTFSIPFDDVATGSGTLTTDDIDDQGRYKLTGLTGTVKTSMNGVQALDAVGDYGCNQDFTVCGPVPAYLYVDAQGNFTTDSVQFYGDSTVSFFRRDGDLFGGMIELAVPGATLDIFRPNGAVPEPETWALMVLGFGLTGAAMRRRRAATVAA